MANIRMPFLGLVAAIIALLVLHVEAAGDALQLTYCSSQNTGSDQDAKFWTWQSNGWCSDQCRSEYAFAVVNGNDCWCSNYIPADQADTGDCDKGCPGFPEEKCGSSDGSLFGYIKLNVEPSGTQGGSQPTSTKVSPSSTPTPEPTSSSSPPPEESSSETPETTTSQKATSAAPTTLKTSTSESPQQPTTNTEIIYISGAPVTRTIIYTPTVGVSADASQTKKQGSTNTGAIVGGVVGGVAGIAALVGVVFFLLWRRRKQQREAGDDPSGITRNVSTMSKSGLLRSEKGTPPQYPPQIATNIRRNSRIMSDGESISPISGSDRRSSRPFVFDQRLNPSTVLMNLDNNSRGSFNSIDDSRDYGRTLNVRNPDPNPE